MHSETKQSKPRCLRKVLVFKQRITKKTSIVLAILFGKQYTCQYPDPDACPQYDPESGFCTDAHITCSYRKKF